MKKLILILFALSACSEQEINPRDFSESARTAVGCAYSFRFGILPESTMTQVIQNVSYSFNIKTTVNAMADGSPLWPLGAKTSINSTITYRVWNTGASTIRYKVNTGSWVNIPPSNFASFTRLSILRSTDCTSTVTVLPFNVYIERVNCGTMPPGSNHFNGIIEIYSASNAYTVDHSIIGFNTSVTPCPL